MRLYQSLAHTGKVVLLADETSNAHISEWLEMEGCVNHDFILWYNRHVPLRNRVDQVNYLRREGYGVDLLVEPDPGVATEVVASGVTTLLFAHAAYAHPSWRPDTDTGVQPWSDLSEQIAIQARLRARDSRLKRDDQ
jgi:hypothetical protein